MIFKQVLFLSFSLVVFAAPPPTLNLDGDTVSDPTCSICYDDFSGHVLVKATPCNHEFHADCLAKWTKQKSVVVIDFPGLGGSLMSNDGPTCPNCRSNIHKYSNAKTGELMDESSFTTITEVTMATTNDILAAYAKDPKSGLELHKKFIGQFGFSSSAFKMYLSLEKDMESMIQEIKNRKAERNKKIMELDEDATVPEEMHLEMQKDNMAMEGVKEAQASIEVQVKEAREIEQYLDLKNKWIQLSLEVDRDRTKILGMNIDSVFAQEALAQAWKRKREECDSLKKQADAMKARMERMESQLLDKPDRAFFDNREPDHQGKYGQCHAYSDIGVC